MRNRQFIVALIAGTVLGVANVYAGGSCVPNGDTTSTCHWELTPILDDEDNPVYLEDGKTPAQQLTISGNGAIKAYGYGSQWIISPWFDKRNTIKNVVIEDGITNLPSCTGCLSSTTTNISIPNSVTTIGYSAFEGATGLTSLTIPNSVTSIGNNAFKSANALKSLVIPDSVTSIGDGAFFDAYSLETLELGKGLTSIGAYAFRQPVSLTSLVIPDTVTSIGDSAFYRVPKLTSLKLSEQLTSIPNSAFYAANSLKSLVIPDSVTSIGDGAFFDAYSLETLELGKGLTSIGAYAFRQPVSLRKLVIPDTVTSIGAGAFWRAKLSDLTVSAENLQRFLESGGEFLNTNAVIKCTTGDCKEILKNYANGKYAAYAENVRYMALKNPDGSTTYFDDDGNIIGYKGKRIYTIDEATLVSKPTGNTFKLRYK